MRFSSHQEIWENSWECQRLDDEGHAEVIEVICEEYGCTPERAEQILKEENRRAEEDKAADMYWEKSYD